VMHSTILWTTGRKSSNLSFFFFMVLGFELRASLTLWATSLVLFACCFSEKVVHFWPGWPWTLVLPPLLPM
jgi:hypothetical protein